MLEWPEIEVYKTVLSPRITGATITAIDRADQKVLQGSEAELEREVIGKTIWFLERRGKHLLFHLDNGKRLQVHLSNKAVLTYESGGLEPSKPSQITIHTGAGRLNISGLRANDIQLLTIKQVEEAMKSYGPDPFDKRLTFNRFMELFAKKRGALKSSLSDQQLLAGIGPLYADEIAFAAAVRPDLKIPLISKKQWERLYASMRDVLHEAAAAGGLDEHAASLGSYDPDGYSGSLRVYEREGEPCRSCGTPIERIELSSKKAYYCPVCQREEE